VDKLAVGLASGKTDFEGTLNAYSVCRVDYMVVFGVDSAKHGTEAFHTLGLETLLQLLSQFGVRVGQEGYSLANGLNIEAAAAHGDNSVVAFEKIVDT